MQPNSMKWKNKCKKLFTQNRELFDFNTIEEWISSEDFFEALWYYLKEEVKAREEMEDIQRERHRYEMGLISPIEVTFEKTCGI